MLYIFIQRTGGGHEEEDMRRRTAPLNSSDDTKNASPRFATCNRHQCEGGDQRGHQAASTTEAICSPRFVTADCNQFWLPR